MVYTQVVILSYTSTKMTLTATQETEYFSVFILIHHSFGYPDMVGVVGSQDPNDCPGSALAD